jgi:hypothetical protein
MEVTKQIPQRGLAAPLAAAAAGSCTTSGLAAAGRLSTTSWLAAAVAGTTSWLAAAIASTAGGLAAAIASATGGLSTAGRLAAAIAAALAVTPLALREQALQPAEKVMRLALPHAAARIGTAGRLAAAISTTGRLTAAIASTAGGLAAAVTGIAARLASASRLTAGITAGLAAMAEHPIKKLETIGLATQGDAEHQRTEKHHTLHRATSPLLVDHARLNVPTARSCHPEDVIHELFCGRPVEPFRDSIDFRFLPPPWLPDGHSDAPGDTGAIGGRGKTA